jgi:cysteine desulfurase
MNPVYLDYNASTPVDPRVAAAMWPYIESRHGNPSSIHPFGRALKEAIDRARSQVASLLEASPEESYFNSGASESNNTVLKGVAFSFREKGNHIITTSIEHPSILNACGFLEKQGIHVTYLPVDRYAMVDPEAVRRAITPRTILISVMHANNEVGTVQPVRDCSRIAREHGILFHTDAAQSVGKIPVSVQQLGVDLMSVAGHKFYAPKGVGVLFKKTGVEIEPLIHGAGQEMNLRSGTQNAAYCVAIGKAAELAAEDFASHADAVRLLRDEFQQILVSKLSGKIVVNGHPEHRLPNTLHVSFRGITGVDLLSRIPDLATSTGAACHSGQVYLSATLKAIGIDPELGAGSVRFSLGRFTTRDEIQAASDLIINALNIW